MTDLSKLSCVVFDHGQFVEVALRLARDFGKVYYTTPWQSAFCKIDNAVIGDGFDEIERVSEIWDVIDRVDLVVFPDVNHSGLQRFLERTVQCPVWGARDADELEIKKAYFKAFQESLGMNVSPYTVVHGLEELRKFCQDPKHTDVWVKLSPQFRGNRETFHHLDYATTRYLLDEMGVEFGALQDSVSFLADQNIDADLESGLDTFTVDGAYPGLAVQGYEKKDKAYFGAVQPWNEIPQELTGIAELLGPILEARHCRQMLSLEVKITEDGKPFLLEPTTRFPSPAGEAQLELYENFSDLVYEGAHGNLVDPVVSGRFCCQASIMHTGEKNRWRPISVPDAARHWIKLSAPVCVGDSYAIAPSFEGVGSVVGIGDSPTEALDHLKENAQALADQPVVVHVEAIAELIQEIEEAQSQGLFFSRKRLPGVEEVLTPLQT